MKLFRKLIEKKESCPHQPNREIPDHWVARFDTFSLVHCECLHCHKPITGLSEKRKNGTFTPWDYKLS